jgi:hypothetical protein
MTSKNEALRILAAAAALSAVASCGNPTDELEEQSSAVTVIGSCPAGYFTKSCTSSSGNIQTQTCTCYLSSPTNPTLSLDWVMADQTGVDTDGDGIVNLSPPGNPPAPGSLVPASFPATLDGCPSTPAPAFSWDITSPAGVPDHKDTGVNCSLSYAFPTQGTYRVVMTAKYANGWRTLTKDVVIKNFLIVSMGDSVAAGEGNPDVAAVPTGQQGFYFPAKWENQSCHRSAKSGPALAALQLERADKHSSVTFVSEACSGAGIRQGLLGPYAGEYKLPSPQMWAAQIAAIARAVCPSTVAVPSAPDTTAPFSFSVPGKDSCRAIDALLVQVGANDLGFGTLARACSAPSDCTLNTQVTSAPGPALANLKTLYDNLAADINKGLNVRKVFAPEYPDILRSQNASLCTQIVLPGAKADAAAGSDSFFESTFGPIWLDITGDTDGKLSFSEINFLDTQVFQPLNRTLADAAMRNGWIPVTGIAQDFRTHGYCSTTPWVIRYEQSWPIQVDHLATFHPNAQGQADYASHIATAIVDNVPGAWVLSSSPGAKKVKYTTADFNADGKTDMIVTTSAGSTWYLANGDGNWTITYERPDLTLGNVDFVPADFNGDHLSDLIVVTPSGSYWYVGNGDGMTWNTALTRTDLPLGSVKYVTGRFNWDARTDLLIQTNGGSYVYLSTGTAAVYTYPYTRTDLPLGVASYVPGDFDGDMLTDLIITTPGGSYWYYSLGDGTWTSTFSRSDLGNAAAPVFTVGDFARSGSMDFIVTTAGGSTWQVSTARSAFKTIYTRTDLTTANTVYTTGDFDGDLRTDLVIVNPSGSYWYLSNGDGTWRYPYTRPDLPLGTVRYVSGTFDTAQGPYAPTSDLIITNLTGSYWYFSGGDGATWTAPYVRNDLVY